MTGIVDLLDYVYSFAELYKFFDCCGMVFGVKGVFCLLGVLEGFASVFPAGLG